MSRFPANPSNGMLFEQQPGCLFRYDSAINSWVRLVSNDINLPLASTIRAGAMAALDLKKLNRLVLPPPRSTIIGNDCVAPFRSGVIQLAGGDDFVSVEGNLKVRNIDQTGETVEGEVPYRIHQHTFGYDFTLDLPFLITALKFRNRYKTEGPRGLAGPKGERGAPGSNRIAAGPAGPRGGRGNAPTCDLNVEPEPISSQVRPGLKKAFVSARVVENPNDNTKFTIEFDRQNIGIPGASANKLNVQSQTSSWVLALASVAGAPQRIYYVDVAPILAAANQKFVEEVELLKKGYEDIVQFWVQTMSDLFDEQKNALCCALEFCISKTKSIDARQHMENVAAAALPHAKIQINPRDSSEAVKLSSMGGILGLPGGKDLCSNTSSIFTKWSEDTYQQQASESTADVLSSDDSQLGSIIEVTIDPLNNVGLNGSSSLELSPGTYTIILYKFNVNINNEFYAPIAIQHINQGKSKTAKFLNKGRFQFLHFAQKAYQGLTTSITHDGGLINIFFNIYPTENVTGEIKLLIIQQAATELEESPIVSSPEPKPTPDSGDQIRALSITPQDTACRLQASKLKWYENSWKTNRGIGCIINIGGQDYVVIKRSIGDDTTHGGGESPFTPCVSQFLDTIGHPAIAWPTFDGQTFAPLSADAAIMSYSQDLNNLAIGLIREGYFDAVIGSTFNAGDLADLLNPILFPASF